MYRRRSPEDDGFQYMMNAGTKNDYLITNADIVPFNADLLLRFECHINMEVVINVSAIKYISKYILKGSVKIGFDIAPLLSSSSSAAGKRSDGKASVCNSSNSQAPLLVSVDDYTALRNSNEGSSTPANNSHAASKGAEIDNVEKHRENSVSEIANASRDTHSQLIPLNTDSDADKRKEGLNEVRAFRQARWCGHQAAWKIFRYTIYHIWPNVV